MPYRSPSARLPFTLHYSQAENTFLASIIPWEKKHWSANFGTAQQNAEMRALKTNIKAYLIAIQGNYCGFCGINLDIVPAVHREHIAPQYKNPHYIFEPENLVLSCYYCNMHKMKKLTMTTDTKTYSTEQFMILHPYRDDYNQHLSCNFANKELVFKVIAADPTKALATIDCVGLDAPHLMTQRAALILMASLPSNNFFDSLYRRIISWKGKARKSA